jgi:serine/threonine protein kinase
MMTTTAQNFEANMTSLGYTLYQTLGDGTYGSVTRAESPEKNQVAIKKCKFDSQYGFDNLIENEILNNFSHPNVMRSVSPPVLYLKNGVQPEIGHIMELGTSTLEDFFRKPHTMDTYISMFSGLFDGLRCLHAKGFLHLDIKPANIIIMQDGTAKLTDFSISVGMLSKTEIENGFKSPHEKVTITYRPLENIPFKKDYLNTLVVPDQRKKVYGGFTDVFSLGLCFLNTLMGETHYAKLYDPADFDALVWGPKFYATFYKKQEDGSIEFSADRFIPENLKLSEKYTKVNSFLKSCLHIDPSKRLKIKDIKRFALFNPTPSKRKTHTIKNVRNFSPVIKTHTHIQEPDMFYFFLSLMQKEHPNKSVRMFFLCWDLFDRVRGVFEPMDVETMVIFQCVCFNLALKCYECEALCPAGIYHELKAYGQYLPLFTQTKNICETFVQKEKIIIEMMNGKIIRPRFDDYCFSHTDLCTYAKLICTAQRSHNLFCSNTKKEFIQEINQLRSMDTIMKEESKAIISKYTLSTLNF